MAAQSKRPQPAYQMHRIYHASGWPQGHGATSTKTKSHTLRHLQAPDKRWRAERENRANSCILGVQGVGGSAAGRHALMSASPRPPPQCRGSSGDALRAPLAESELRSR
jgi:hypothetical protein